MARVELTDDAKDDIRGLDRSVQARIIKDLEKLEISPEERGAPLGSRKSGNLTGLRKLYVGPKKGYRAVYAAEGDDELAVVMVVAGRTDSECYDMAVARLELVEIGSHGDAIKALIASLKNG
ncbi:Uncharacterised protein [Mycobacteroides abscessus subsp. massiliense]|uniref:type II toxin-antitoxin system RelE family toxin n=1 Tax=Mycobacteroides abscessus TaxID=36809 RepID=UPI00031B26D9|nr:type II toxin-antitoxin system RelE/ParE family toxin [Mycobacteroides abscessus]ANN97523.1 addiction module antitoxin [Mycobacteroides abscessus]SKY09840.1 Uncharacterised protein [Mycobacteroides abscessus subsp. bolletii]SLE88800.1 Uncharacterised protein [Mycobacteroides abscessus subsp. massiliense]SLH29494.1 Uncharacterised protein [Mycobacteroides abscessus subsp. massiliense]